MTGASAPSSATASWARNGSALKPGLASEPIASSNACRGIRSRASTSRASSRGGTDAGIDTGADHGVGDHVRGGDALGAGRDGLAPQRVEPACHEHGGAVEVELALDPPDPGGGQLGELGAQPLDELGGRLDGDEIRFGEVPVVVRLLLRAPGRQRCGAGVEVVRRLHDLATRLPHLDLARDLGVDPAGDERERVHVLQLAACPQLVRTGGTHGDVGVDTQRSLLHLRVRDAELDDRLPQELEEALRLLRRMDVGRGHDLDERRPTAVEVDEGVLGAADPPGATADVRRLGRVLLEVRAHDPDHVVAFARRY